MTNQDSITIPSNSTEYIPYSIRHNITDKDLAGLLDYLESEMEWEIQFRNNLDASKTIEDMNDPDNKTMDSTILHWRKHCDSWMIIWR